MLVFINYCSNMFRFTRKPSSGSPGQFWGLRYCLSKPRSLLSFSVRYDVTQ